MEPNGVIERKLDLVGQRVSRLRALTPLTTEKLDQDYFLRSGIERTLQVCIEAMIDVANRILCLEGRPPSTDSFGSLQQLQDLGILASAERYRNMIKFRNLIVHRYEQIETDVLTMVVNRCLDDFDGFVQEIQRYEQQT